MMLGSPRAYVRRLWFESCLCDDRNAGDDRDDFKARIDSRVRIG